MQVPGFREADLKPPEDDFVVDQGWAGYAPADHATWTTLFRRQTALLPGRASAAFLEGLETLNMSDGIPDFDRMSDVLEQRTGWRVVAVPGLVPDDVFFWHLANRRFPATNWIRPADRLDYLQEPDVFHDVFGHVPVLMNPVFADYLQAYGRGGLKALRLGALDYLARLYWYTVEFGLIREGGDLRIYGSGIVSSKTETIYSLDSDTPNRLAFDLKRIMQTDYRIDDVQETYFVIDDFAQLFDATRPDFAPYYEELKQLPTLAPGTVRPSDTRIA